MTINLKLPDIKELKPKITVFGVGGAGGNAVNNMIRSGLEGVEFVCANTDSQALMSSKSQRLIQMGVAVTEGLGAGSMPEVGRAAAEEVIDEITDHLAGSHMIFVTAGMGGGTGTGAAPVIARIAREHGILTVGVVTKPFQFEGARRMRIAEAGIKDLQESVDTLIVIPNQNLFRIANDKTTFADAFAMADQVLYSGVACITDLMVKEGLINLDFADVRSVMREMGKAMMGTGEASGDRRAQQAAEAAIANPLLDETSMRGAKGLLISITGGRDLTLFEVDEAATRIREEVDPDANIILGATFDEGLEGVIRVSVVATGIDAELREAAITATERRTAEGGGRQKAAPAAQFASRAAAEAARPHASTARQALGTVAAAELSAHAEPAPAQVSSHDAGVTIAPYSPAPANYAVAPGIETEPVDFGMDEAGVEAAPFIPPQPETLQQRVPRIEEFPPHAQREAQRARGEHQEEDRGPLSLLRRLANVGLGRREEDTSIGAGPEPKKAVAAAPAKPAAAAPRLAPVRAAPPAANTPRTNLTPQPAARPATAANADYGKRPQQGRPQGQDASLYRPRQGDLDPHGRALPQPRTDDDHLEIPAFLRRQAN